MQATLFGQFHCTFILVQQCRYRACSDFQSQNSGILINPQLTFTIQLRLHKQLSKRQHQIFIPQLQGLWLCSVLELGNSRQPPTHLHNTTETAQTAFRGVAFNFWANKNVINLRGLTQVKESRPSYPVHHELCAERPVLPRRWRWRHAVQVSSPTAELPDPVNIVTPHVSHSCHVTGIYTCPTLTMSYLLLVTWLSKVFMTCLVTGIYTCPTLTMSYFLWITWLSKGVHDMSCHRYLHMSSSHHVISPVSHLAK